MVAVLPIPPDVENHWSKTTMLHLTNLSSCAQHFSCSCLALNVVDLLEGAKELKHERHKMHFAGEYLKSQQHEYQDEHHHHTLQSYI